MDRNDAIKSAVRHITDHSYEERQSPSFTFPDELRIRSYDELISHNSEHYYITLEFDDDSLAHIYIDVGSEDATAHILNSQESFNVPG